MSYNNFNTRVINNIVRHKCNHVGQRIFEEHLRTPNTAKPLNPMESLRIQTDMECGLRSLRPLNIGCVLSPSPSPRVTSSLGSQTLRGLQLTAHKCLEIEDKSDVSEYFHRREACHTYIVPIVDVPSERDCLLSKNCSLD